MKATRSDRPAGGHGGVDTSGATGTRRWVALILGILVLALGLVVTYRLEAGPGYPLDDSWIHLAFARHLAHGAGFGINPGQASTGSTAPLWALLLSAGFVMGADHTIWPWLLGAFCLAASGVATALAIHRVTAAARPESATGPRTAAWIGGLLVVATPVLVWSAAGAMEVPLFTALMMLAWAAQAQDRARGSERWQISALWGIPAGLAALARPEGLLFASLLGVCSRPRSAMRNLLIASLFYAPYPIYCFTVSGRPFPSTFYAKTTTALGGLPGFEYLRSAAALIWTAAPAIAILFLAGMASVAWRALTARGRWIIPALPGLLFIVALPIAYSSMGRAYLFAGVAGNFGRYLYPVLPFMAVAGTWGIAGSGGPKAGRWVAPASMALLLAWNGYSAVSYSSFYAHNVRDINALEVEMAGRLARRFSAGSRVAANDVGALAYFTDLKVLDLVGIVSPEVQGVLFPVRHESRRVRHEALLGLLRDLKPDAIVVFPDWYPEILQLLSRELEPIEEIRVEDNITAASGVLVAYRFHWGALSR